MDESNANTTSIPTTQPEFESLMIKYYNYTGLLSSKSKKEYNARITKPHPIPDLFKGGASHYDYPLNPKIDAAQTTIVRKLWGLPGEAQTITKIKPRFISKAQFGLIKDGIAHFPWTMTGTRAFVYLFRSSAKRLAFCILWRACGYGERPCASQRATHRSRHV